MPDHRNDLITDRHHLEQLTTRAINDLVTLARHWLDEDHAACAPRATGNTGSRTTTHGDQTDAIATGRDLDDHQTAPTVDRTKYADRDRLGNLLAGTARRLHEEIQRRTPRTPTGHCTCCQTETATHGPLCFACDRYLRIHGRHCNVNTLGEPTDKVHSSRATTRWCECPATCCPQDDDGNTSCADHAAEGRRVSERCRTRMHRARQATA